MGPPRRPLILEDCLDRRIVRFSDNNQWQLTEKVCEKPWNGSYEEEREEYKDDWEPHEAHAVYECTQVRGFKAGAVGIMKIRLESVIARSTTSPSCRLLTSTRVPHDLPPSNDSNERAKDASGMRLNSSTSNEIEVLERLTAARCSVTPALLAFKIDVQDDSVLNSRGKPRFEEEWGENRQWWMPGGYIVYILMSKLDAQPLDTNVYWDFDRHQRDEVRSAFKAAFM